MLEEPILDLSCDLLAAVGFKEWQRARLVGLKGRIERGEVHEDTSELRHLAFIRYLVQTGRMVLD